MKKIYESPNAEMVNFEVEDVITTSTTTTTAPVINGDNSNTDIDLI